MASRSTPYTLSLPALIFVAIMFLLPTLDLLRLSFTTQADGGGVVFSLEQYRAALTDPYILGLIWRTLKLGVLTTAVTLVVAFPVALHLRQVPARSRSIITFILISPLLTSVVVRTLGWVTLLGPNGPLNKALHSLGLSPLHLLYNETGIVIGLVHVCFGYMVLCLMTSILNIDESLLLAANNLGAGRFSTLFHIIIPLSIPGGVAGSVLVFAMSTSTYATPVLLGGSRVKVLASQIYDLAITFLDWPAASALSVILLVLVAIVVWGCLHVGDSRHA